MASKPAGKTPDLPGKHRKGGMADPVAQSRPHLIDAVRSAMIIFGDAQ
jgi:hypothetical protein